MKMPAEAVDQLAKLARAHEIWGTAAELELDHITVAIEQRRHHADLAPGTSHFRTSIAEGQALMKALQARVSGLAMPTYVLDIPGGVSKAPLTPAYLREADSGQQVQSAGGDWIDYRG